MPQRGTKSFPSMTAGPWCDRAERMLLSAVGSNQALPRGVHVQTQMETSFSGRKSGQEQERDPASEALVSVNLPLGDELPSLTDLMSL